LPNGKRRWCKWAGSKLKWLQQLIFQLKKFKVKVWSPVAGKKTIIKIEGANGILKRICWCTSCQYLGRINFDFTMWYK
jgi:hypothetical protein